MKRIPSVFFFFIALTIGLFGSVKAQAQVNMSRFIKLTVAKDSVIKLDFKAATDNTPVKVKSGSLDTTFMVGTALHPKAIGFTAGDSTMTVYGDLTAFFCRKNQDNITALDVSNNTELMTLSCYNNAISSLDVSKLTKLTDLYCFANSIDSLDLKKNEQLKFLDCSDNKLTALDLSKNTMLEKINCSNNEITSLDVSKMTELNELRCHVNKIESLDVSNNAKLRILYCAQNKIPTLNVSNNTKLEYLGCGTNNLTSIDVSMLTELKELYCGVNKISNLDISKNTKLKELYCGGNNITSLDVSNNTDLTVLSCYSNKLTTIDVTKLTKLTQLYCYINNISNIDISKNLELSRFYCYDNSFSTRALDSIYCSLPDRGGKSPGKIQPVHNPTSANNNIVVATNKENAEDKNWRVQYYKGGKNILTDGTYACTSTTNIAEASAESALTLYPNPVGNTLYLSVSARNIRIYNIYGTEVAKATDTASIDVSYLPAGVYTVNADGKVAKMVKQ